MERRNFLIAGTAGLVGLITDTINTENFLSNFANTSNFGAANPAKNPVKEDSNQANQVLMAYDVPDGKDTDVSWRYTSRIGIKNLQNKREMVMIDQKSRDSERPVITPDGRIVYIKSMSNGMNPQKDALRFPNLWIMNSDGSNDKPLTHNEFMHVEISGFLDNNHLLYSAAEWDIFTDSAGRMKDDVFQSYHVLNFNTAMDIALQDNIAFPYMAYGNNMIAYISVHDEMYHLCSKTLTVKDGIICPGIEKRLVDFEGVKVQELSALKIYKIVVANSGDIYYVRNDRIHRCAEGAHEKVADGLEPVLNRDSSRLAYNDNEGSIVLASHDAHNKRTLADAWKFCLITEDHPLMVEKWHGNSVLFSGFDSKNKIRNLYAANADNMQVEQLTYKGGAKPSFIQQI